MNVSSLNGGTALMASGGNGIEAELNQAFSAQGISTRTGVFTRAASSDGILDQLRAGDASVFRTLGLSGSGGVLFADLELERPTDTGNLMRTNAYLHVTAISLRGRVVQRTFEARGAGFDASAARHQAVERVAERAAADPELLAVLR